MADSGPRPLANAGCTAYGSGKVTKTSRGGLVPKIKGYLNVPQTAEKLGVSEPRIRALIKSGQLVPDLVDGCFAYFRPSPITNLKRERRTSPGMTAGSRTAKTKDYPTCPHCTGPSRKWTAYAGKQRWRCVDCGKVFYAGGDENLPVKR